MYSALPMPMAARASGKNGRGVVVVGLLAALTVHSSVRVAQAQWLSDYLPWAAGGDHLPFTPAVFRQHLRAVDITCCGATGFCDAPRATSTCSPHCAAILRVLMRDCGNTTETLMDGMGGVLDGVAQRIDHLQGLCHAIPTTDIVAELSRLQDDGNCVVPTDGVAETAVGASDTLCSDTTDTCTGALGMGFSCDRDYCPTCTHAAECDMTCGFCGSGDPTVPTSGHRRAQIDLAASCSQLTLQPRVDEVNSACCDMGACATTVSGVPTRCDAKCSMVCE